MGEGILHVHQYVNIGCSSENCTTATTVTAACIASTIYVDVCWYSALSLRSEARRSRYNMVRSQAMCRDMLAARRSAREALTDMASQNSRLVAAYVDKKGVGKAAYGSPRAVASFLPTLGVLTMGLILG